MSNAIIKLGTAKFNKWLNQCPIDYKFSNDEKNNYAMKGLPFAVYFGDDEELKTIEYFHSLQYWNNGFDEWLNQCPVDYEFLNDEKKRAYTVGSFAIYFD